MLAAMASLAVCRLGSSLLRMEVGTVVVCFMVSAPLFWLLHFMPSRHVATCRTPPGEGGGSKAQGEGVHPSLEQKRKLERKGRSEAKVCTSEARKTGDTPCAARGAAPTSGFWAPYVGTGNDRNLPQLYSLFLRLYCRHGRRTCFYDPATPCGQDLLQLQGFPASAAHTGREVLREMPGGFRIKAKGLPALHVADGLALPVPRGGFEDTLAQKVDLA